VHGYHDTAKAKGPGITLGRSGGSFGKVTFIREDFWPHNTTIFVTDFKGNDPVFIRYLLESLDFSSLNSGSAQQSLNRNFIYPVPVRRFPLQTQRRIAGILSTYDELIENNQRRIPVLQAMARALYREWFVHLRFPGYENVPNVAAPVRQIPEGWDVKKLNDLFRFIGGAQPPKDEHVYEEQVGYVRFIQNRDYGSSHNLTYIRESPKNKICDRLDIMVDKYGEAGKARFGIAGAYNVALAKLQPHNPCYREWLRGLVSETEFNQYLASASQAATRPSLNSTHFNVDVVVPPKKVALAFQSKVEPLLKLILTSRDSVTNLRRTRDLLLPRLLSDRMALDVSNLEKAAA
jgi:type I restriction enzyme S subunit